MSGIPLRDVRRWLEEGSMLVDSPHTLGTPLFDEITGACIDSRLAGPGCLFVALEGERTDGHLYVDDAVSRGAAAALVSSDRCPDLRSRVYGSATLFPVSDPLSALHQIALRWRETHPQLVRVGITGSNGKTTTKEMVASVLSYAGRTVFSHGNYNSDIGLPVELLRIRPDHKYGVYEVGMNRPGEIEELAGLLDPNIAVITNVGSAHVGRLGSRRRIAEEKKSLFSRFNGSQTAIVPPTGQFSRFLALDVAGTVVRYGMKSAGVTEVIDHGMDGSTLVMREGPVKLRLAGEHMVQNALAALSVARLLDIPFEWIQAGIESVTPVFGRAQVIRGRVTLLQDCYNANPESMETALNLLSRMSSHGRKIAVLGAMKELGASARAAHRAVADLAGQAEPDAVWFVGDEYEDIDLPNVPDVRMFADDAWEDLRRAALQIEDGDTVLLKGSRSLELERLTGVIQKGTVNG